MEQITTVFHVVENLIFSFISSPWFFLVIGTLLLYGVWRFWINETMEARWLTAVAAAGLFCLAVAAILWKLSRLS